MLGLYRQWTQPDPVTTCYGSNGVVTILTNDRDTRRMPVLFTLNLFDSSLVRLQFVTSHSSLTHLHLIASRLRRWFMCCGSLFECRSSDLASILRTVLVLSHLCYTLLPHHCLPYVVSSSSIAQLPSSRYCWYIVVGICNLVLLCITALS